MSERLHIVPHDQGWALKREGASKIDSSYPTQKEAIDAGRDIARQDEVDLVVHRQDGTFRNVLTYTNEPMSDTRTNSNGKKVEAHDLYSVGSRVSWGAIVAGAAVALALNAVLWLGGAALGITVNDKISTRTLTVMAAVWMLCSSLASLFVGGFVVSRLTAREDCGEAILYGVILWGFMFALTLALSATGVAVGTQMANFAVNASDTSIGRNTANMNQAQIDDMQARIRREREEHGGLSPQAAAWWAFASLVLSVGAAVGGSWLGSGPDFFLVARRTPAGTTQVPVT